MILATRGSALAMAQAAIVKKKLEDAGEQVTILPVKTKGDRDRQRPLTEIGGNSGTDNPVLNQPDGQIGVVCANIGKAAMGRHIVGHRLEPGRECDHGIFLRKRVRGCRGMAAS